MISNNLGGREKINGSYIMNALASEDIYMGDPVFIVNEPYRCAAEGSTVTLDPDTEGLGTRYFTVLSPDNKTLVLVIKNSSTSIISIFSVSRSDAPYDTHVEVERANSFSVQGIVTDVVFAPDSSMFVILGNGGLHVVHDNSITASLSTGSFTSGVFVSNDFTTPYEFFASGAISFDKDICIGAHISIRDYSIASCAALPVTTAEFGGPAYSSGYFGFNKVPNNEGCLVLAGGEGSTTSIASFSLSGGKLSKTLLNLHSLSSSEGFIIDIDLMDGFVVCLTNKAYIRSYSISTVSSTGTFLQSCRVSDFIGEYGTSFNDIIMYKCPGLFHTSGLGGVNDRQILVKGVRAADSGIPYSIRVRADYGVSGSVTYAVTSWPDTGNPINLYGIVSCPGEFILRGSPNPGVYTVSDISMTSTYDAYLEYPSDNVWTPLTLSEDGSLAVFSCKEGLERSIRVVPVYTPVTDYRVFRGGVPSGVRYPVFIGYSKSTFTSGELGRIRVISTSESSSTGSSSDIGNASVSDVADSVTFTSSKGQALRGTLADSRGKSYTLAIGEMGTVDLSDGQCVEFVVDDDPGIVIDSSSVLRIYSDEIARAINLSPEKIVSGNTFLGVAGTASQNTFAVANIDVELALDSGGFVDVRASDLVPGLSFEDVVSIEGYMDDTRAQTRILFHMSRKSAYSVTFSASCFTSSGGSTMCDIDVVSDTISWPVDPSLLYIDYSLHINKVLYLG